MRLIDTHMHLNDSAYEGKESEIIARAKQEGTDLLFCAGFDLESSIQAVNYAEKHDEVYAFVGFHPENLEGIDEEGLKKIEALASSPKVIAIGEVGLDYHWFKDPKDHENQKKWFIAQIELANKLGLPVCIHARDAYGDLLELLTEHPIQNGGVLHCYSGSYEMMERFAKLGMYFGFDGPVTYKNAVEPKKCATLCPIDRILIETDSPYLTPVPYRGKPNEPSYLRFIASQIAALRQMGEREFAEALDANVERLFHVKHGQD
ncbi:MAG: TatD family hydrolase [Candidatus Enteromonas sp.]|nr:TatD family hydrolase [Candidatus Enteromonas sp.]